MANFKACVRRPRKDGFWQVYIRVTHKRNVGLVRQSQGLNHSYYLILVWINHQHFFSLHSQMEWRTNHSP